MKDVKQLIGSWRGHSVQHNLSINDIEETKFLLRFYYDTFHNFGREIDSLYFFTYLPIFEKMHK